MSVPARILRTTAALALFAAIAAPMLADAAVAVSGKPKISFFATGSPGFLDIEGESTTMTATDDGTKMSFVVPMKSVTTGIDMRDEHMNEKYVEVAKFPNATLSVAKADVTWPATLAESKSGTAKATFNIHGVDQPVTVEYTLQRTKTGYRATAKFAFDAAASGIEIPAYMGVTVDPKMHAEVKADLIDA